MGRDKKGLGTVMKVGATGLGLVPTRRVTRHGGVIRLGS